MAVALAVFAAATLLTLLIVIGAFGRWAARQRRAAMIAFAAESDFAPNAHHRVANPRLTDFSRHDPARPPRPRNDLHLFPEGLTLFALGDSGYAENIVEREDGPDAAGVFDYVYFDGRPRSRGRRAQTVILLRARQRNRPAFTIKPRQDRSHLGKSRHYQHAEDSVGGEFAAHYELCTETEAAADGLARCPALGLLATRPGLCVEAAGPELIVFMSGQVLAPEALPALLRSAREIDEGLPVS